MAGKIAMEKATKLVVSSLKWIAGQGPNQDESFFTRRTISTVSEGTHIVAVVYSQHAPLMHPAFLAASRLSNTDCWKHVEPHTLESIDPATHFRLIGVQPIPNDGGDPKYVVTHVDFPMDILSETSKRFEQSEKRVAVLRKQPQILEAYHRGVCAGCGMDSSEEATVKVCNGCKMVRFCSACKLENKTAHRKMCKELRKIT